MRLNLAAWWCVLLAALPASALRPPPSTTRPTRRTALRSALALPLLLAGPSGVSAKCICKSVTDCVCTEDNPDEVKRTVKRADAAGRDVAENKQEREAFLREMEAPKPEVTRTKAAPRKQTVAAPPPPPPPQFEKGAAERALVRAEALQTQEFSEMDPNSAKRRFALVVQEAIRKREAQLGFELDKDDIQSLIGVLRIKYCGPQGQIGPC